MLRRSFGGGPGAVVIDPTTGRPIPGAQGTAWSGETGGTRYTNLQDIDAVALPSGVITADQWGRVRFTGPPDGTDVLWVDFGHGRFLMVGADIEDRAMILSGGASALAGRASTTDQTVTGLDTAIGQPSGLASLDVGGKIPPTQVPTSSATPVLDDLADVAAPAGAPTGAALTWAPPLWVPGQPGSWARLDTLPTPLRVYDGGGTFMGNTLPGIRWAAAAGYPVQVQVNANPDRGVTLAPTPTVWSYAPTSYTGAYLRPIVDADADFEAGSGQLPVPTLDQVLDVCAGRVPLVIYTDQGAQATSAVVDTVLRRGLRDSTLIWPVVLDVTGGINHEATLASMAPAVEAGLPVIYGPTLDWVDPRVLAAAGVRWVCALPQINPPLIAQMHAQGLRVIANHVDRHVDRDTVLAAGFDAMFTSQPLYLGDPAGYRSTQDRWAGQAVSPGMIATDQLSSHAAFASPNWWKPGYDQFSSNFTLQGWACPLPNTQNYVISFDVRWDAVLAGDAWWLAVAFGCPTDQYFGGRPTHPNDTDRGYTAELRFDGGLALRRWQDGAPTDGPVMADTAPTVGQISTYHITVSDTTVSVGRVGGPTATWADTTWRGGYLHIGLLATAAAWDVSLRNLTVV